VEYTALPSGGGPVTATASAAAGAQTKTFTDPHGLVLTDLISGTTYSIRVQVMGSGNQTTEFCEAVTHMAT
jgi:mannose/fructose-specific phosphotransferase system component IIA